MTPRGPQPLLPQQALCTQRGGPGGAFELRVRIRGLAGSRPVAPGLRLSWRLAVGPSCVPLAPLLCLWGALSRSPAPHHPPCSLSASLGPAHLPHPLFCTQQVSGEWSLGSCGGGVWLLPGQVRNRGWASVSPPGCGQKSLAWSTVVLGSVPALGVGGVSPAGVAFSTGGWGRGRRVCWGLGARRQVCLSPRVGTCAAATAPSPAPGASLTDKLGLRFHSLVCPFTCWLASEIWGKRGKRGSWVLRVRHPATQALVEGCRVPARDSLPLGRNSQVWAHRQTFVESLWPPIPRPRSAHRILLAPRPALGTPESCQILLLAPTGGWEVGVSETDLWASPGFPRTSAPDTLGRRTATLSAVRWPHPVNSAERPPGRGSFLSRTPFASPGGHGGRRTGARMSSDAWPRPRPRPVADPGA